METKNENSQVHPESALPSMTAKEAELRESLRVLLMDNTAISRMRAQTLVDVILVFVTHGQKAERDPVQAEEARLYRDLTGDAMAMGYDGIPAALRALKQSMTVQDVFRRMTAQGLARTSMDNVGDVLEAVARLQGGVKADGLTDAQRWQEVVRRIGFRETGTADGPIWTVALPTPRRSGNTDENFVAEIDRAIMQGGAS